MLCAQTNRGEWMLGIGVLAVALEAGGAASQTVTIQPSRDNSIYQAEGAEVSNGLGASLVSGRTMFFGLRRALIAFDVSAAIPAGATVASAELTLNLTRVTFGQPAATASLHRLTADWGEGESLDEGPGGTGVPAAPGDATWEHRFFDAQPWTSQGGDFASDVSASQEVAEVGEYTWASTSTMVADVQGWLDDPASSFGWIILIDEDVPGSARRFASRQVGDGTGPQLRVTYTVAPPACPADFNGDSFVNPDDLSDFITCFFLEVQFPRTCPAADFNADAFVNPDDLSDFITGFFLAVQFGC